MLMFRLHLMAILADRKQAFLNIEISEEHKDFLHFLCYDNVTNDEEAKLIVLRFLGVVFGVTSSPFILNGII